MAFRSFGRALVHLVPCFSRNKILHIATYRKLRENLSHRHFVLNCISVAVKLAVARECFESCARILQKKKNLRGAVGKLDARVESLHMKKKQCNGMTGVTGVEFGNVRAKRRKSFTYGSKCFVIYEYLEHQAAVVVSIDVTVRRTDTIHSLPATQPYQWHVT